MRDQISEVIEVQALSPVRGVSPPGPEEGEYGAVTLPGSWPVLSFVFFVAALAARVLVGLVPRELRPPLPRPLLAVLAVLVFSALGLLFGLLGRRNPQTAGTARIAIFLNAVALVLSLLATLAFFVILRR